MKRSSLVMLLAPIAMTLASCGQQNAQCDPNWDAGCDYNHGVTGLPGGVHSSYVPIPMPSGTSLGSRSNYRTPSSIPVRPSTAPGGKASGGFGGMGRSFGGSGG